MKKRKIALPLLACSLLLGNSFVLASCGDQVVDDGIHFRVSYQSSADYEIKGLEKQYEAGEKVSFTVSIKNKKKKLIYVVANKLILNLKDSAYSFEMPSEHVSIQIILEDKEQGEGGEVDPGDEPGSQEEIDDTVQPFTISNYQAKVSKQGTFRFEAEKVDVTNYKISSDNSSKIVERSDASDGKFLAAATGDNSSGGYFAFSINCDFAIEFTMSVAYAQSNKWKGNDEDLTKSYTYILDENKNVTLSKNTILSKRDDITKWDIKEYDKQTVTKGVHTFKVSIAENTGVGNPNIDYMDFKIRKIEDYVEPEDESTVPDNDFHTQLQYDYIHNPNVESIEQYAKGAQELSRPRAIKLDFSKDQLGPAASYYVEIADDVNFTKNYVLYEELEEYYLEFYNLMLGQKFYWRAGISKKKVKEGLIHELEIASEGPRNLYVDGISNFRDIGGYDSDLIEGGKVKQGLYFRGANPNSVTDTGKETLYNELGIRVEIDMRDSYQCTGPYIDGIEYHAESIPSGTESRRFEEFADVYKRIFTLVHNADKAPIYLHCTAGADRTGISTFMLLTLCGVSYTDLARDYLFTNFSTQGSRFSNFTSEFKQWWSKLDKLSGNTKADKAESWLMSKGLTYEQCEHIREIFVPGYEAEV